MLHWPKEWANWVRLSRERALRFCGFLHLIPWWSNTTKISFGKYFLWDIKQCPKELWKSWWEGKGPLCSRECFAIQAGRWISVSGPFPPNCVPFAVSLCTVIFWSFFLLSLVKGLLQEPMATQKWFLSTHSTAKMHSDSWSCYCSVPLCLVLQEKNNRTISIGIAESSDWNGFTYNWHCFQNPVFLIIGKMFKLTCIY